MAATSKIAESKLHIGTNSATLAAESSWEEVVGLVNWSGNLGGTYASIDTSQLADIVNQSAKGTLEMGTLTVIVNERAAVADPGLVDMKAAYADRDSDLPYNFKITSKSGVVFRFKAHVMSSTLGAGQRNGVYQRSFTLDLQTEVERVEPA